MVHVLSIEIVPSTGAKPPREDYEPPENKKEPPEISVPPEAPKLTS